MPTTTPVTNLPGTLPFDCWPATPQELNVAIVTGMQSYLDEVFPGIYVGTTAPPANQRNRLWFNTASSRWYHYINGGWMRQYQYAPSSSLRMGWAGTEAELKTFDGGSDEAVGIAAGPLWEIDHTVDGRTLVGPGTIPDTDPAITIAQGATVDSTAAKGLYAVTLTPENCQHYHGAGTDGGIDDPPTMLSRSWSSIKNFIRRINDVSTGSSTGWHDDTTPLASGTMGTTEPYADPNFPASTPHLNMQPYIGQFQIKRTARIWVSSPY